MSHSVDTGRLLSYEAVAMDVAELLKRLGIGRAHVVGYSMGGAVGFQLAVDRPDLVARLVFAGGPTFDTAGLHPESAAAFDGFDPHSLDGTRWHEAYRRVAPDPDHWPELVAKVNELDRSGMAWPAERIANLGVPVMLVAGDADIVRLDHVIEFFHLLGGGVPGDLVGLPAHRLAILPGTTHVGVLDRIEWLSSMIGEFLSA